MNKILLLSILLAIPCHAQMITEGVNKGLTVQQVEQYRLAGIIAKAKQAESDLAAAKNDAASLQLVIDTQTKQIATQTKKINDLTVWGNKGWASSFSWEHKTEVVVEIFALLLALGILPYVLPAVKNLIAGPWAIFLTIGVSAAVFFGCLWLMNFSLDLLAYIVPTIPPWEQIKQTVMHLGKPKLK